MTWKKITKALRRFNSSLFSFCFPFFFPLFFPFTETALGPIWFGFSMNYHGLDPVSTDKAPKMSQLYPYPPYEYATTCSHLPIVFSFVLVSDNGSDNVSQEDVAKGSAIDI